MRTSEMQIALAQKRGGDEIRRPWGAKEMRETDCQEVKKPRDGDHGEGMDSMGLGMACEDSRGGGEMENICSVYLLRSRIHDHNPAAVPQALSAPPLQRITLLVLCFPLWFRSFHLVLYCNKERLRPSL